MVILSIDPGSEKSAWLLYDTETKNLIEFNLGCNFLLLGYTQGVKLAEVGRKPDFLAIEMIASYGMPVGKSVFETCLWIGRFIEAWGGKNYRKVYRKTDVCMHLCHNTRAKDSNIRPAIIDRYGGQDKAIGNKKCPKCKGKGWFGAGRATCPVCGGSKWKHPPGPLCDVSSDVWSALAVAIFAAENMKGK